MDEGEENGNEKKNLVSQGSSGKLKPVFESIFAEVQANIPVLNLDDISDDVSFYEQFVCLCIKTLKEEVFILIFFTNTSYRANAFEK